MNLTKNKFVTLGIIQTLGLQIRASGVVGLERTRTSHENIF